MPKKKLSSLAELKEAFDRRYDGPRPENPFQPGDFVIRAGGPADRESYGRAGIVTKMVDDSHCMVGFITPRRGCVSKMSVDVLVPLTLEAWREWREYNT